MRRKPANALLRWLLDSTSVNGIFNVGTDWAESFRDMISAMFKALRREPNTEYIDMPDAIRSQYQYFTQTNIKNLRRAGYNADEAVERHLDHAGPERSRKLGGSVGEKGVDDHHLVAHKTLATAAWIFSASL